MEKLIFGVLRLENKKTRSDEERVLCGDGGNRTRVQKIRPSEIYERSRLKVSPPGTHPAKLPGSQSLRPESPLSPRA